MLKVVDDPASLYSAHALRFIAGDGIADHTTASKTFTPIPPLSTLCTKCNGETNYKAALPPYLSSSGQG